MQKGDFQGERYLLHFHCDVFIEYALPGWRRGPLSGHGGGVILCMHVCMYALPNWGLMECRFSFVAVTSLV